MTREEIYNYYKDYPLYKLEDMHFILDMIDTWTDHDKMCYDVISQLIKEKKEI